MPYRQHQPWLGRRRNAARRTDVTDRPDPKVQGDPLEDVDPTPERPWPGGLREMSVLGEENFTWARLLGHLVEERDDAECEDERECEEQDVEAGGPVEKDEHEHGEP
jgi:hypothetical protein